MGVERVGGKRIVREGQQEGGRGKGRARGRGRGREGEEKGGRGGGEEEGEGIDTYIAGFYTLLLSSHTWSGLDMILFFSRLNIPDTEVSIKATRHCDCQR